MTDMTANLEPWTTVFELYLKRIGMWKTQRVCRSTLFPAFFIFGNPHAVEGTINKDQRDDEEKHANACFDSLIGHGHGDFSGEQTKQRGEFDNRIHRHRAGVLEGIAH